MKVAIVEVTVEVMVIGVGRGPSGPSREVVVQSGSVVHWRQKNREKKRKKKRKKINKRKKK